MILNKISDAELDQFINYCWDFYGPDGVIPLKGLTIKILSHHCKIYSQCSIYSGGDSRDREIVRMLLDIPEHSI